MRLILLVFMAFVPIFVTQSIAATRVFNLVAVEASGTKVWLPSTIVVNKGDDVEIHAVSKVPAPANIHGLAIDEFKITEAIDEKGKTIKFKATKVGVYPIRCHLHPAHIGGQLVVLK